MLYRCSAMALFMLSSFCAYAEKPFMQFSALKKSAENSPWTYYQPNQPCFNWPAEDQGKWCRADGWRFFWYYNYYQTEHMGFLRFGHMLPDTPYAENGLLIAATGGAYRDAHGDVGFDGAAIKDADALEAALKGGPTVFSKNTVPGAVALYYKHLDPLQKIPEFSQNKTNRLSMMIWLPQDAAAHNRYSRAEKISARPDHQIALYPFINSGKAGHYYHHAMNRGFGQWVKVQFDAHPTHHNQPTQPALGAYREGGFDYPGNGAAYFSSMTSFSLVFYNAKNKPDPYMMMTDHWMTDWVPFENEETINNLSVGFDPKSNQFDISFEDKYRCAQCFAEYEIRYSEFPITNANWSAATPVKQVQNYFIEDDNPQGVLKKPSPYYTQVWGKLALQDADFERLSTQNKAVYIAVKDLSVRNFAYDTEDDVMVPSSESGAKLARRSLVKSIRYPFMQSPDMPVVNTKKITLFEHDRRTIAVKDAVDNEYAVVEPAAEHQTYFDYAGDTLQITSEKPTSAYGALYGTRPDTWIDSWTHIYTQSASRDCLTGIVCKYDRMADLSASGVIWSGVSGWKQIQFDKYSGYREGGIGILLGTMGDYNFATFSGPTFNLSDADVMEIAVTNTTSFDVTMPVFFSTEIAGRRTYADSAKWQQLPAQKIPAKNTVNYYIKASLLPPEITMLNVNLPYNGVGVSLSGLGRYTQTP